MPPMPVYEYACTACGERTEAKQGFDDPPLEECLVCGGKLRKLFSPVGIVFKGSGFYSTDARKPAASDSDAGKAKDSEKKAGAKGESRSESRSGSEGESRSGSKDDSRSESRSESKADSASSSTKTKNRSDGK